MKIDIEGHEEAVLIPFLEQAPEDLLPRLIVIENNYMKWKRDLLALAKTRGYVKKNNHTNECHPIKNLILKF
jgi:hypothetical protein